MNKVIVKSEAAISSALELDSITGNITVSSQLLEDISKKLNSITEKMENDVEKESHINAFKGHQSELRMLSRLMHYLMKEVAEDTVCISKINTMLLDEIVSR